MHGMRLERIGEPLREFQADSRPLNPGEIRIRVSACAVCRTDLHLVDGDLPNPNLPIVPGHEIIGRVSEIGTGVARFKIGDRVGVPWLGWACGKCEFCLRGEVNICPFDKFTGYQIDGVYGSVTNADACYLLPILRYHRC